MKIRCLFTALCICLFVFPVILVAQGYDIQWADTIDNGGIDEAQGVAVDNSNNIIVTGYSEIGGSDDYFIVKYDSNGTILWQDTIDNGNDDWALDVAVDNSNNIIVTGYSYIGGNQDYFTVKYDSNGTIQWADTIDNGDIDFAYGVAVDNSNNIIVTGTSKIGGDFDYFTVKYDSNGTILWADTIDNGSTDIAVGVAVDNSNNIIVTGGSEVGGMGADYFTVKYDSNGTILWQDTLDNGNYDWAYGVAIDNSNNIIVTGYSLIGIYYDYFTVKYDSNGTILWQDTIDNGGDDLACGVAVDNSNNIVVTGYSDIGGDFDYFTVKYVPIPGISEDEGSDLLSDIPVLYDIYPNPAGDEKCVIRYCLPCASDVEIKIYNIAGALVRVLENTSKEAGYYTIYWDNRDRSGRKVSNGVYFSRFFANPIARIGDYQATKKLLIMR